MSHASPKYYLSDPMGTILPNVMGTHYLFERARADGVEAFLFISSGEVYGQIISDTAVAEEQYGYLDPDGVALMLR